MTMTDKYRNTADAQAMAELTRLRAWSDSLIQLVPDDFEMPLPPLPADGSRPPLITQEEVASAWVLALIAQRDEAKAEVNRLATVLAMTDEIANRMQPVVETAKALLQIELTRNAQVEHSSIWLEALKGRRNELLTATRRYVKLAAVDQMAP